MHISYTIGISTLKKNPEAHFYTLAIMALGNGGLPNHYIAKLPDFIIWKCKFQLCCLGEALAKGGLNNAWCRRGPHTHETAPKLRKTAQKGDN